jgi:hypothetical protein
MSLYMLMIIYSCSRSCASILALRPINREAHHGTHIRKIADIITKLRNTRVRHNDNERLHSIWRVFSNIMSSSVIAGPHCLSTVFELNASRIGRSTRHAELKNTMSFLFCSQPYSRLHYLLSRTCLTCYSIRQHLKRTTRVMVI